MWFGKRIENFGAELENMKEKFETVLTRVINERDQYKQMCQEKDHEIEKLKEMLSE